MVDPLVQMSSVSASHLQPVDMATYMVNCLYLISSTLALYEFTDQRLEMLQAQVSRDITSNCNSLMYMGYGYLIYMELNFSEFF